MVNGNLQKEGDNQFLRWRIRSRFGIIAMALGFALIVWVVDALLDYFVFYKGHGTFLEILVTHLPAHEIYIRMVILVCFVVFGVIVSFHISKRKRVEEKLKKIQPVIRYIEPD